MVNTDQGQSPSTMQSLESLQLLVQTNILPYILKVSLTWLPGFKLTGLQFSLISGNVLIFYRSILFVVFRYIIPKPWLCGWFLFRFFTITWSAMNEMIHQYPRFSNFRFVCMIEKNSVTQYLANHRHRSVLSVFVFSLRLFSAFYHLWGEWMK